MKISTLVEKETDVKILKISLCVRDNFYWELLTLEWEKVCVWEDTYVPNSLVPGSYWDYVELEIDIDTWKILNRPHLDSEKLKKIISDTKEWKINFI